MATGLRIRVALVGTENFRCIRVDISDGRNGYRACPGGERPDSAVRRLRELHAGTTWEEHLRSDGLEQFTDTMAELLPDAVAFAVLILNFCAPFIDHYTQTKVYGTRSRES